MLYCWNCPDWDYRPALRRNGALTAYWQCVIQHRLWLAYWYANVQVGGSC